MKNKNCVGNGIDECRAEYESALAAWVEVDERADRAAAEFAECQADLAALRAERAALLTAGDSSKAALDKNHDAILEARDLVDDIQILVGVSVENQRLAAAVVKETYLALENAVKAEAEARLDAALDRAIGAIVPLFAEIAMLRGVAFPSIEILKKAEEVLGKIISPDNRPRNESEAYERRQVIAAERPAEFTLPSLPGKVSALTKATSTRAHYGV